MTADPEPLLVASQRAGAQQAEAFLLDSQETTVRFEANRLKEITSRRTSGAALRLVAHGRIGFASSTRPDDVTDLVAAAMETAPFGPQAHFDFPPRTSSPNVDTFDPAVEALPLDSLVDIGRALLERARDTEPELLCDALVRRTSADITIANTAGALLSYRRSTLSAWIHGTLIRGTDMLFVGDGDASCRPQLDLDQISASVARQLRWSRRQAQTRTAELPVIFTPIAVAEALLPPLAMAFSGRLVYQRQSPLLDRLGQQVYDPNLTVHDDATLPHRVASRPFDDEGVPSRPLPLIDSGVVRTFLYDLQTAGLAGAQSTASAQRSLSTQPAISTANLLVANGAVPFEEMVRGIAEGLVVEELMGAGQGNVLGGDFSGNVLLGYKIENGEIAGRVKDTMVAGNVHNLLSRIAAIGNDGRWVGGTIFAPSLMFDRLTVSAEG